MIENLCIIRIGSRKTSQASGSQLWECNRRSTQNTTLTIIQTEDGYLWFGPRTGLERFNGTESTILSSSSLKHAPISMLLEDKKERELWIASLGSGLIRYNAGQSRSYTTQDGLPSNYLRALAQDSRGNLWIGTDKGLAILKDGRISHYAVRNNFLERT